MTAGTDAGTIETGTVVIGAGFSGLGMAIQLRKDGRTDFVVLEKAQELGGAWHHNTYPGASCDIPSRLYSYSYEQNPDWTQKYPPQQELLAYLHRIADKYRLRDHLRLGVKMTSARWDHDERRWHVTTSTGQVYVARYLVNGLGNLHVPHIPELPGQDRFTGAIFHSAQWNHDVDLRGKRVAVIGTGASASQFIPKIVDSVGELHVYQRNAPWVLPKNEARIAPWKRAAYRWVPGLQRLARAGLFFLLETRVLPFSLFPSLLKVGQVAATRHLHKAVADPGLRAKLTPSYVMGCKRVLLSNDFYPALCRDNVEVVTDGIADIGPDYVQDNEGVRREVDVIILGTGFRVTDAYDHLDITGREGRNLAKEWHGAGNQAHFGMTVAGYPNMFFLLGPNTTLGGNSAVFMIESQTRYVAELMRQVDKAGMAGVDVKRAAQNRYQAGIQRQLSRAIWTVGGCVNWYLDAHGLNRTLWPGFTWRYWQRTRKVEPTDFEFIAPPKPMSRTDEPGTDEPGTDEGVQADADLAYLT